MQIEINGTDPGILINLGTSLRMTNVKTMVALELGGLALQCSKQMIVSKCFELVSAETSDIGWSAMAKSLTLLGHCGSPDQSRNTYSLSFHLI